MIKRITKKQLSGLASAINEALRAKGCNWEVLVTPRFGAVTIDITEAGSGINRSALPALLTHWEALLFLKGMGKALYLLDK